MFGERLKELRERASLTQQELADKLKISRGRISMYESKPDRQPSHDVLNSAADFFTAFFGEKISTDFLTGRSDRPHLSATETKKLRTIKDVRRDLENDKILDVDGKPFTPEGKQLALMQIDALIKMREMGK